MLLELLLIATMTSCSPTKVILPPGETRTDDDDAAIARAEWRCPRLYPKSPCVRSVERRKKLSYWVICGRYNRP